MRRRHCRQKIRESRSCPYHPAWQLRRLLYLKISKQLAVKIVSTRLGDHVDRARRSQSGRWRQQRLLDSDLLDGTHRNIHGGCAHGLVSDVESIHLHPGGAAIATDDRGRGKSNLGSGQYLAVEQLHSRFQTSQIEESAIGRNLFHTGRF